MPKTIKEIQQDYTGTTTVEYSDGSTRTYTVDDVPTTTVDENSGATIMQSKGVSSLFIPTKGAPLYFSAWHPEGDESDLDSDKLNEALDYAYSTKQVLVMPSGRFALKRATNKLRAMVGDPNNGTIIVINTIDKSPTYANQFAITNGSFTTGAYNEITADEILLKNITFEVTPQQHVSVVGLANVKSARIENVKVTANKVVEVATGRPWRCDALIDLYASCKNVKIVRSTLKNITGARGSAYPWAEGGGGCIWVRNLLASASLGADLNNATENIEILNCDLIHQTSDEAIAVYGVVGMTRNVKMKGGSVTGLAQTADTIVTHNTLVSAFPLKHPTLGANAAVEDVIFDNVTIKDSSWMYSVLRFGNSSDGTNLCRRIKAVNCNIIAERITTAGLSPNELWVNAGSPGASPDANALAIRAIQNGGSFGAYKNASLELINGSVVCNGGSTLWGVAGFDSVVDYTIKGTAYYGVAYVTSCANCDVESSAAAYYNCGNVVGGNAKVNIASDSSAVFVVDISSGRYNMVGVQAISAGGLLRVTSVATSSAFVSVSSNSVSMSRATAFAVNNLSSTALVRSHCNTVTGTMSAGKNGTIVSANNYYGGTSD